MIKDKKSMSLKVFMTPPSLGPKTNQRREGSQTTPPKTRAAANKSKAKR